MRLIFATCLTLFATSSVAQQTSELIYRENLEGVYFQEWLISDPVIYAAGIRTVTVTGEGKNGDFKGELYVDCPTPSASKWLSIDDTLFLSATDVPLEAIIAIRTKLCADS